MHQTYQSLVTLNTGVIKKCNLQDDIVELVGREKASRNIPVKDIVDSGALTTFSSDYDVSTVRPQVYLYKALLLNS